MGRHGAKDARGKRRPLTDEERKRIVYFLANTEEATMDVATRRFQRDAHTLRRIAIEAGVDLGKFKTR